MSDIGQTRHPEPPPIKDEKEWLLFIKEEEIEESARMKGFKKYLVTDSQESESPGVKEKIIELYQLKEEEPEPPQQQKRKEKLPITKEDEELPYVEEDGLR
ncbi:uncharacterized protein LOC144065951 [Stigmatopora argus]